MRVRPSDSPASYPVDIAVFRGSSRDEDDLVLVVECKKKTRRSGRRQLEIYLTMNQAPVGVWFNGEQHLYLRKHYLPGGEIVFEEDTGTPPVRTTSGGHREVPSRGSGPYTCP